MKNFIRNIVFFLLLAVILLLNVTCIEPSEKNDDDITYGPVQFDTLDIKGEQVWMPNYNTGKVSQMFLKFEGDRTVDVIVELIGYDDKDNPFSYIEKTGSGKIEKGILKFKVDVIDDSNLLDSDEFFLHCFNEWYYDKNDNINIFMDIPDVKGNIITLVALYKDNSDTIPAEGVIREGFFGTDNSFTGEYIYYLYVNKDCTISAKEVKKTDLKYTFNKFDLSLKAGWNTICKSETYTTTGDSSYSITVSNPSIRWVMQKMK